MSEAIASSNFIQFTETHSEAVRKISEILEVSNADMCGELRRLEVPLAPPVQHDILRVTEGVPELLWTCAAAAAALVLRRFGSTGPIAVVTEKPLTRGLAVLLEPSPDLTFREWLGRVRDATNDALNRKTEDSTRAHRSANASETGLVIGKISRSDEQRWPGVEATLMLEVLDDRIVVASRRLPDWMLHALANGVASVLARGLSAPGTHLVDISVLEAATLHEVLNDFNLTSSLDSALPFRELLLAAAEATPDAIAVHDDTDSFTYRELCSHASIIASSLRQAGVVKDTHVALIAPRSAWFLVMAIGIIFAGGAYLPIDPSTPASRRARLLRGATAVITGVSTEHPEDTTATWFEAEDFRREVRDTPAHHRSAQIRAYLGPPAASGDLAYIMFTSGSTGNPKGVCIEHHSFLNLLATRVVDYDLRPGVEIPQTAPLSFDLSIWQMFAGLTVGATICVVPDDVVRDPEALVEMAVRHHFECLALVPTFIAVLVSHFEDRPSSARDVSASLKRMVSTGEIMSGDLAARWHAIMPRVQLLNAYGPAEVADDGTGGFVSADEGVHTAIGKVLPNVRVYILDKDMQPLPPSVVGEIYIGGESVGRGYYNEPAMTAAVFVPDPFATAPGMRMYRTGDRGRWRPGGAIELLGRLDNQVKLRGRRVEPGEIEHTLRAHPSVGEAVVQVVRTGQSEKLIVFVVTAPGADTSTPSELADFAATHLPDYMVPKEYVTLRELPRNRNGKVDHNALRANTAVRSSISPAYIPPSDRLEEVLCEVWARLLSIERIGLDDDFFDLGGDSITAIRIVQAAGRRGFAARPRHLLESRTVAKMAAAMRLDTSLSYAAISSQSELDPAPLTPVQLAFLARDVPNPNYWNHGVLYTLTQPVPTERVAHAAALLASRHPALKTLIVTHDGNDKQIVSTVDPPVTDFDLTGVAAEDLEMALHDSATELHATLNLHHGPVCRIGRFQTANGMLDRLVVVIHHAMVDLYSWDVLTEDFSEMLQDGADAAPLLPSTSYSDWARLLADRVRTDPQLFDDTYWRSRDWAACARFDTSDDAGVEGNTQALSFTFDEAWTVQFTTRCASIGVSVAERLLICLGAALRTWLDPNAGVVQVQLGGHGREDLFDGVDLSRTVGYFSTAYPFALPMLFDPVDVDETRTAAEALRQIPGRGFGYEALRYLHPNQAVRQQLAEIPVPQILFNYWGEPDYLRGTASPEESGTAEGLLTNVRIDIAGDDRPSSMPRQFPVEVYVRTAAKRLTVLCRFSGEVFTQERMEALQTAYLSALRDAINVPAPTKLKEKSQ